MLNHIELQDFKSFEEDITENFLESVGGVSNLSVYANEDLEEAIYNFIENNYFEYCNAPSWIDLDILVENIIEGLE